MSLPPRPLTALHAPEAGFDCKGSAGEYNAPREKASPKYCIRGSDSSEYGIEPTATVEIN